MNVSEISVVVFALVLCKDVIANQLDHLHLWPVHYFSLQSIFRCISGNLLAVNGERPFRLTVQENRFLSLFLSILLMYLLIRLAHFLCSQWFLLGFFWGGNFAHLNLFSFMSWGTLRNKLLIQTAPKAYR